jgi:hypothetical protein
MAKVLSIRKGKIVPYKKGETRLSEILKHLGVRPEGGGGTAASEWSGSNNISGDISGPLPAGSLHRMARVRQQPPIWPIDGELPYTATAKSAARLSSFRRDPLVQDSIAKVTLYLQMQRDLYYALGHPLGEDSKSELAGFFSPALLNRVRIVELKDRSVDNPWFYEEARERGIQNLPDIAHKVAVTFLDVVVFNQKVTQRDLFHGLVHAGQVKLLGVERFAELFVVGFLQARSYFLVPLKAHAFALDTRYAEDSETRFSVEDEIRRWAQEDRY